jgi:hypothetical protein
MKKGVCVLFILLMSCGGSGGEPRGVSLGPIIDESSLSAYGDCKHMALVAAAIFEQDGYATRIMYGSLIGQGGYHVQAQAFIDGEWRWLRSKAVFVYVKVQDQFIVEREYSIDELYENIVGGVWY